MKVLLFADLHATPDASYGSTLPNGLTDHLVNIQSTLDWIAGLIQKLNPDLVVNMGDSTDTPGLLHTATLKILTEGFNKIHTACRAQQIPLFHMLGNHDIKADSLHNLCWLNQDLVVSSTHRYKDILMIPWGCVPKSYKKDLKLVLTHIPLKGAPLNNGLLDTSEDAFEVTKLTELRGNPGVVAAHYHRPAKLSENAQIIGSVITRTFSDMSNPNDKPRGVLLCDTKEEKWTAYKNPHSKIFRKIELVSSTKPLPDIPEDPDRYVIHLVYDDDHDEDGFDVIQKFPHCRVEKYTPPVRRRDSSITSIASPQTNLKEYLKLPGIAGTVGQPVCEKIVDSAFSQYVPQKIEAKDLRFERIQIKDFLSLGDISFQYPSDGLIWVQGDNGAGKTSLMIDAPYWILTGSCLTKDLKGDSVLPHTGKGKTKGTLVFTANGSEYIVTRTRKPSSLSVTKDGKAFEYRTATDIQKALQEHLGSAIKYLEQSVFVSGSRAGQFLKMGYAERARTLEAYYDNHPYAFFETYIQTEQQKLLSEKSRYEQEVAGISGSLSAVRQTISSVADQLASYETAQENNRALAKKRFEHFTRSLTTDSDLLATVLQKKEELEKEYRQVEDGLRSKRGMIEQLTQQKSSAEMSYRMIYDKLMVSQELVRTGRCDKCGASTTITQDHLQSFTNTAVNAYTSYKYYADQLQSVEDSVRMDETRQDNIGREIAHRVTRANELQRSIEKSEIMLNNIQQELNTIEEGSTHLRSILSKQNQEEQALTQQLSAIASKSESLGEMLDAFTWWSKHMGVKGFRSYLLDQIVDVVNYALIEYSPFLFGTNLLRLTTTRQTKTAGTKNEVYVELTGYPPVEGFSDGEKSKVNFLIQIALSKLAESLSINTANVLVVDEVSGHLDPAGIKGFTKILEYLGQSRVVFGMSHNPISYSGDAWTVEKTGVTSRLATQRGSQLPLLSSQDTPGRAQPHA